MRLTRTAWRDVAGGVEVHVLSFVVYESWKRVAHSSPAEVETAAEEAQAAEAQSAEDAKEAEEAAPVDEVVPEAERPVRRLWGGAV
jgi:hypothetical protein